MAKTTYEDTKGNMFNTQAEAAASNTRLGTNPKTNINTGTIPVKDSLMTTPTPVTLQQPKADLTPTITLPDAQTETEKEIAKIKAQAEAEKSGIASLISQIGTEQGKESQYITAEGGDTAQKEYDKYKSDLEAEQLSLRRTTERLQRENPEGLFGGGLQQEISRLERESLSKQADIAILANAAKGRYDTARDIAQRKVESAMAPLKAELEAKKFIYENNSALFSKAELSKLDSLIKADERKIEEETKDKEASNTMIINALQGKAPQSVVVKAQEAINAGKDSKEVAKILGNYSLSIDERLNNSLKQAQLSKLNAELDAITGSGLKEKDKVKVETYSDIARLAQELKTLKGKSGAVGATSFTGRIPGTEAFNFRQKTNQLINTLAAGNLDKLKGAMSDNDIVFLQKINTSLDTGMTEEAFDTEINRIYNTITGKLKEDYGVDFKIGLDELSNDDFLDLPIQNQDNTSFFNNL